MTLQEFETEFGPFRVWPYPSSHEDIVTNVNEYRALTGAPRTLDGVLSTWGWIPAGVEPSSTEIDWTARAEALRIVRRIYGLAHDAQLKRRSQRNVGYAPLLVRLGEGSELLERLKQGLGMLPTEDVEVDELTDSDGVDPEELPAYTLFFGSDAISAGVEYYFSDTEAKVYRDIARLMAEHLTSLRRIRCDLWELELGVYGVAPDLSLGITPDGHYAVGLWSYEDRS